VKSFRELKVWQKAHALTLKIYEITRSFPADERFTLVSQIRRSTISIPANIVEGFKRRSDKDYAHFLNIAEASLEETKYFLILARDLKYMKNNHYGELLNLAEEIGKMLHALRSKLNP